MFQKSKLLRFDSKLETINGDRIMGVSKYYRLQTETELAFAATIRDEIVAAINEAIEGTLTERQEKLIFCALVMGKSQGLKTKDIEPICGVNQTVYNEQMGALRVLAHSGIDRLNLASIKGEFNKSLEYGSALGALAFLSINHENNDIK